MYKERNSMFINITKANLEIGKLKEELANVTKDRDSQATKLKEFEAASKGALDTTQTIASLKEEHQKALETSKTTYEAKIAELSKEIASLKESHQKEISTVKESVTKETIAIVASQGTNAAIETVLPEKTAREGELKTKNKKANYKVTSFASNQKS